MKTFQFEKSGNTWLCKDKEAILYYGDHKQGECVIRNAYQQEIIRFTYEKGGFKLFRSNKPVNFSFTYEDKEGSLEAKERTYEWMYGEIEYTFVLGTIDNTLGMILRDHTTTLGYVLDTTAHVHALYTAEVCGVWMLMQEIKNRIEMEDDKFTRSIKKAELVCI